MPQGCDEQENISIDNFIIRFVPYLILAILYGLSYLYFNSSTQFIMFIIIFILNFFTILFFYKDFLSIQNLSKSIFGEDFGLDVGNEKSIFTKVFIFAIFITLILNIATFGIILAVFDYGKRSTNDYLSYKLTDPNMALITNIKENFKIYFITLFSFACFVIYSHTNCRLKLLLQNIIGLFLSIFIIVLSIKSCISSVEFLNIKKHHKPLYSNTTK